MRRSFSPLMLALLFTLLIVYLPIVSSGNFTLSGLPSDMPAVFVDPPLIEADLGEVFTISVKVFNLSNNCYMADFEWAQGEPLPTPGTSYNYSLGNIMGFDIQFSWDPEILEYVSHTKKIPVEDYPNGILHEPLIPLKDEVDSETGTYHIAESTLGCFPFNMPDGNATVFDMSFVVKGNGSSELNIIRSDLASAGPGCPGYKGFDIVIPHRGLDGQFSTPSPLIGGISISGGLRSFSCWVTSTVLIMSLVVCSSIYIKRRSPKQTDNSQNVLATNP